MTGGLIGLTVTPDGVPSHGYLISDYAPRSNCLQAVAHGRRQAIGSAEFLSEVPSRKAGRVVRPTVIGGSARQGEITNQYRISIQGARFSNPVPIIRRTINDIVTGALLCDCPHNGAFVVRV